MRRNPFTLLFLVLVVLGPGASAQQREAAFVLGLKKVERTMKGRKWKRALDQLARLLEAHAKRDYVYARKAEIIDLHRRCLFRSRVKAPRPDDVVSGELLSHNLATGRIKIRYNASNLEDFKSARGLRLHTAKFAGPYTIEIKGKAYPGWLGGNLPSNAATPPSLWVCCQGKDGFIVSYGFEQRGDGRFCASWVPARIASVRKKEVVAEKGMTLARSGKPFRLKVKVGKISIHAYYNNKPLLKARKPERLFGRCGFSGLEEFDEILIQGQAEPSWLQGRRDAAVAKQRAAFARAYRPNNELPPWLFRRPPPPEPKHVASKDARDYPGPEPSSREARILKRASALLEKHAYQACLDYLEGLGHGRIDAVRLAFLTASCLVGLGDPGRAAPYCRRVCEEDPAFLPAQAQRVRIAYDLGRRDEALTTLKGLIEDHPGEETLRTLHVLLLLEDGRVEEARAALLAARRHAGPSRRLAMFQKLILKAARGPDWNRVHEHRSAHYHIFSDIDRRTCVEAARILEDAYRAYNVHLKRVKKDNRRFRVFLFSGRAGFRAYCRDAMGGAPVHTAGLYSRLLKQLLIWNLPDRGQMMRTVRHEGFHQYVDRIMRDPPAWFNEGLAEYYETADYVNGSWRIGKVRPDHLETLKNAKKLFPLEDFIYLPARRFYRQATPAYAQAWAFVHFLLHGPKQYRPVFRELFERLQGDDPTRTVLDRVFGAVDLELMETDFRLYLKQLARSP